MAVKSIYITGSSLFLKKYRDVDYVYYYDSLKEAREAFKKNHNHKIDIHFCAIPNATRIFLGCYIYPLMRLCEGEEILSLKNFSIFNSSIKEKYISLLKKYYESIKLADKRWYHILTVKFMYENNSIELTSEQLDKIQNAHDNGITKQLKAEIGEWLCQ